MVVVSTHNQENMRLPSSLRYLACFWLVLSVSVVDGEMTDDNESPSHGAKTNDNDVGTHYWLVEDYPNPESDEQVCNTGSKRLCDPDSILSTQQISQVSEALALTRRSPTICRKEDSDAAIEIQLAVALAKNVDLSVYSPYEDEISKAAEVFARKIHDDWGIGMETSCGGTGLLLFLSIHDRAIFISRGKAMEGIMTDSRLDRIIKHMKPFLRKQAFAEAIENAIEEIDDLIKQGEPAFWERLQDLIAAYAGFFWFAGILGFTLWSSYRQKQEQRRYAQVASHLDEIDRARALALQGQYKATSCPICLEAFQKEEGEDDPSKGSDGKPIKLLRCGHVFDESCWQEWVSSGQGQVNKCPICKHDIGRTLSDPRRLSHEGTLLENEVEGAEEEPANAPARDEQRVLRQYNFERQFRLARLSRRFPRYIGSQQIQRWTQSTYDGTLARDPSFVRSNPAIRTEGGSSRSRGFSSRSGGGSSFGGGVSAGGRGSRW